MLLEHSIAVKLEEDLCGNSTCGLGALYIIVSIIILTQILSLALNKLVLHHAELQGRNPADARYNLAIAS